MKSNLLILKYFENLTELKTKFPRLYKTLFEGLTEICNKSKAEIKREKLEKVFVAIKLIMEHLNNKLLLKGETDSGLVRYFDNVELYLTSKNINSIALLDFTDGKFYDNKKHNEWTILIEDEIDKMMFDLLGRDPKPVNVYDISWVFRALSIYLYEEFNKPISANEFAELLFITTANKHFERIRETAVRGIKNE